MMKRILAFLLVLALCTALLAACAKTDKSDSALPPESTDTPDDTSSSVPQEQPEETEEEETDELISIRLMLVNEGSCSAPENAVAVMNAITEEKIGVQLEITYVESGSYANQLTMAIAGGEVIDVAEMTPFPGAGYTQLVANGQAMALNDLIASYGDGIQELCGEYLKACSTNGNIYSIPVLRQKANSTFLDFRTDVLEELGLTETVQSFATWEDVTAVFQRITDETDLYAIGGQQYLTSATSAFYFDIDSAACIPLDTLSDTLNLVYLDEDGNVGRFYESENFLFELQRLADWNAAGMVYPDTAVNSQTGCYQLVKSNVVAAYFASGSAISHNSVARQNTGMDMTTVVMGNGLATTSSFSQFSVFIPTTSEEPEAAMRFLNLLYTDANLMNAMLYGEEGDTYVLLESGEAAYPEGMDANTCGYHMSDFWIGNSLLAYPWDGDGADYRERCAADLKESDLSGALGFSLDTSEMSNLISGLSAVYAEYTYPLLSGLYTQQLYAEYVEALQAADVDGYVAEIQAQLDTWHAAN